MSDLSRTENRDGGGGGAGPGGRSQLNHGYLAAEVVGGGYNSRRAVTEERDVMMAD